MGQFMSEPSRLAFSYCWDDWREVPKLVVLAVQKVEPVPSPKAVAPRQSSTRDRSPPVLRAAPWPASGVVDACLARASPLVQSRTTTTELLRS